MLQFSDPEIVRLGALGISLLMAAAVVTHIRLKSTFRRYIASVTMLLMSITILYYSNNEIIGALWIKVNTLPTLGWFFQSFFFKAVQLT